MLEAVGGDILAVDILETESGIYALEINHNFDAHGGDNPAAQVSAERCLPVVGGGLGDGLVGVTGERVALIVVERCGSGPAVDCRFRVARSLVGVVGRLAFPHGLVVGHGGILDSE
jgi:hypothetical protein